MRVWDHIRKRIADGSTASYPRDCFESILDEKDERIAELEAALEAMTEKFCDFAHNSGMMIEDPETHPEVITARQLLNRK